MRRKPTYLHFVLENLDTFVFVIDQSTDISCFILQVSFAFQTLICTFTSTRMKRMVNSETKEERQTWPVLNSVSTDHLVISSSRSSPFGFETRAVVSAVVRPSGSVPDQSDVVYHVAVEYSQSHIYVKDIQLKRKEGRRRRWDELCFQVSVLHTEIVDIFAKRFQIRHLRT